MGIECRQGFVPHLQKERLCQPRPEGVCVHDQGRGYGSLQNDPQEGILAVVLLPDESGNFSLNLSQCFRARAVHGFVFVPTAGESDPLQPNVRAAAVLFDLTKHGAFDTRLIEGPAFGTAAIGYQRIADLFCRRRIVNMAECRIICAELADGRPGDGAVAGQGHADLAVGAEQIDPLRIVHAGAAQGTFRHFGGYESVAVYVHAQFVKGEFLHLR